MWAWSMDVSGTWMPISKNGQIEILGLFRYFPPSRLFPPPVEAVAAATSVFTEYVFCESVDCAHKTQISSTLQEVDCLLKLVKVNKQVFAITLY